MGLIITDDFNVDNPGNYLPQINHLHAFLSMDEGGEGVVAAMMGGTLMPLVAADDDRLSQLIPLAEMIAWQTKKKIKLVKFTAREEVRIIG